MSDFDFSHQTLTWLCTIPRRGVFFFFLRHIVQNGHIWSTNVISGPEFLKNDDFWSNFIKLDQIGFGIPGVAFSPTFRETLDRM